MILVDSSIWVDHFRELDPVLDGLLRRQLVLCHPFVIGEVMMGSPRNRQGILRLLNRLPKAKATTDREVLEFVEGNRLFGKGIGYIDAHLLASVRLASPATIWTRDRRMAKAAETLGIFATDVPKLQ